MVFHQPNPKFPTRALAELGFTPAQWKTGLLVAEIGNTYAGSALIGLSAVLDEAQPGQRILVVSYGSGAGSDAFDLLHDRAHRRSAAPRPARATTSAAARRLTMRNTCACGRNAGAALNPTTIPHYPTFIPQNGVG